MYFSFRETKFGMCSAIVAVELSAPTAHDLGTQADRFTRTDMGMHLNRQLPICSVLPTGVSEYQDTMGKVVDGPKASRWLVINVFESMAQIKTFGFVPLT